MTNSESTERVRLAKHLFDVLTFLVTPSQCYHRVIERYFEWDNHTPGSCNNMCSYCCGDFNNFTGKFHVKMGISDSSKVGKEKLSVRDVELKLATVTHESILTPAHMVSSMYSNMNFV